MIQALLFPIATSLFNCSAPLFRLSAKESNPEQTVQENIIPITSNSNNALIIRAAILIFCIFLP